MNKSLKHTLLKFYCLLFYALMIYKFLNGMFLYQFNPAFFYERPDAVTWIFMQTGVHQWLLNNRAGCILFDVLFYSAPAFLFIINVYKKEFTGYAAFYMLIINWVYIQCYTLYPTNSIEGHIAWILFPFIFIPEEEKTVAFLFNGLRYFFLFFFASSFAWKIAQGGLFNIQQMCGVLLLQHKEMLTNSPGYWQSKFILYLIRHPQMSYLFYLFAALLQCSFIAGFFTRRFDYYFVAAFIIFLIADYLIMRIPYFSVTPFLLALLIKPDNFIQLLL